MRSPQSIEDAVIIEPGSTRLTRAFRRAVEKYGLNRYFAVAAAPGIMGAGAIVLSLPPIVVAAAVGAAAAVKKARHQAFVGTIGGAAMMFGAVSHYAPKPAEKPTAPVNPPTVSITPVNGCDAQVGKPVELEGGRTQRTLTLSPGCGVK